MEKKVMIDENRSLVYKLLDNGYVPIRCINEGINLDDKLVSYSLLQSDDYIFSALTDDEDAKELTFKYDINHPLYFPFIHFLNGKESIKIEDDDTMEYEKKYLEICNENNVIYLRFLNKLDNQEKYDMDKFTIFIKNILFDLRSKIDNNGEDTKERLSNLFNEVEQKANEKYHQMTIEEYEYKKKVYKMENK